MSGWDQVLDSTQSRLRNATFFSNLRFVQPLNSYFFRLHFYPLFKSF